MRIKNLLLGDIKFQVTYGFYFVYTVFTLLYILLLFALPESARNKVATILIYSDPAAMGLFFMGAIVLLEKSQRVLNSIAVSPVKVSEYIVSKVISLGIIGTIVGVILAASIGTDHLYRVAVGTFLGSVLCSLMGLFVAVKVSSLNQFLVATIPFELVCFVPPILYQFGYRKDYLLIHPGCNILLIMSTADSIHLINYLNILGWIILVYFMTYQAVKKMFQSVGGVNL
jgi:fluoroquinolone transport system permease protein